jgi:glucose-6-phosphate 1-dehydrogenase
MDQSAEQPTATVPRVGKQGDPCVMVIFGAAGDLTGRLLLPALYNLARANLLSKEFAVLGVARTQMTDEVFRQSIRDDVKQYCGDCIDDVIWDSFSRRFYYLSGDFNDDKLYSQVKERLTQIDRDHSTHQNFFGSEFLRAHRGEARGDRIDGTKQRSLAPGRHRKAFWT